MCSQFTGIPQVLVGMKGKKPLAEDEVRAKAAEGKIGSISEDELLHFSDESANTSFFFNRCHLRPSLTFPVKRLLAVLHLVSAAAFSGARCVFNSVSRY